MEPDRNRNGTRPEPKGGQGNLNDDIVETTEKTTRRIKFDNVTVIGVDPENYVIPTKIKCECKIKNCRKKCILAPKFKKEEIIILPIQNTVDYVNRGARAWREFAKKKFRCEKVKITPIEYTNVQKIVFQNMASPADKCKFGMYVHKMQRLFPTRKYNLTAMKVVDPNTKMECYLIRDVKRLDRPGKFAPLLRKKELASIQAVANAANSAIELFEFFYKKWLPVLEIEGRIDLFGAMILTYCSVDRIPWENKTIRGRLNTICIGDTKIGKTQMVQRFVDVIGMGEYTNGETNIIGKTQQFGQSKFVTWGAFPNNDRGLLAIGNANRIDPYDIRNIVNACNTESIAFDGIVQGEAKTRTRLIWLATPKNNADIQDFFWKGYGAFQDFIPNAKGQSQFDLVISAAYSDLDVDLDTNTNTFEKIENFYEINVDNWRTLIKQAWTMAANDICYDDNFKNNLHDAADYINDEMGGTPFIVGMTAHEKLLRLSCAFAVLLGSIKGGQLIIVEKHLNFAIEFLEFCLSKRSMSYSIYVQELKRMREIRNQNIIFIRELLQLHPGVKAILTTPIFRGINFLNALNNETTQIIGSQILVNMIKRKLITIQSSSTYRPEKILIDIIEQIDGGNKING